MKRLKKVSISKELQDSYLDYAMSVIISRAIPDARDGLKPVQRRILYSMYKMGLTFSAKFKKTATVVGETLGKYHPHGDASVYDALTRMAQDFSLRYPLILGQGNFGSIDDPPAQMRYTEAKLSPLGEKLLEDIEKDTVDFIPNYDESLVEPKVLPAPYPQLLVNGSLGIAVGTATSIPCHNLSEVIDATIYLIDHPNCLTKNLIKFIPGPDFPTGAKIYAEKIEEIYSIGRGAITVRSKADIQPGKIVIFELPYQVSKADLVAKIARLAQDNPVLGIKEVRDESSKQGTRIVIDLKPDVIPKKTLNFLYARTNLQQDFHFNMVALKDGIQPKTCSLKDLLVYWLEHRKQVITRKTKFDLDKLEKRAHILEGLTSCLGKIDKVIATIKKSKDRNTALENLIQKFKFTKVQAEAILEMKLQSLANLERKKLRDELEQKRKQIKELKLILKNPQKILTIIKEELKQIKQKYGDSRRSEIVHGKLKEFKELDLIPQEDAIVILTRNNYVKRLSPLSFRIQKRGGTGIAGLELREEDQVNFFLATKTHHLILFFTNQGKVLQSRVYEIPKTKRTAKGKLIYNFLQLSPQEKISAVKSFDPSLPPDYLVMVTKRGFIKKTKLDQFKNIRRTGIRAFKLAKNDSLSFVGFCSKGDQIIITTTNGLSIRFKQDQVKERGRTAGGINAIKLKGNDQVCGMDIIKSKDLKTGALMVVSENGFAKQTPIKDYRLQKRGGTGITTARLTESTGKLVSCRVISPEYASVLFITNRGQILKTSLKTIRKSKRNTKGVKIMNLKEGDKIKQFICL